MALVTILTTEGYKQFEDEFPYDLHNVPYGKVVVKADGKYHVGDAVSVPSSRKRSLNRKDRNLTEFWKYIDRKLMVLNEHQEQEFVAIISIIDYGKDVAHGLYDDVHTLPMYQIVWQKRFYQKWVPYRKQLLTKYKPEQYVGDIPLPPVNKNMEKDYGYLL